MADITLDDIMKAPTDESQLMEHLVSNGYVQPPTPLAPPEPTIQPGEAAPMAPPKSEVEPMTPPKRLTNPSQPDVMGALVGASGHPAPAEGVGIPMGGAPEIATPTAAATPDLAVKPMVAPANPVIGMTGKERYLAERPVVNTNDPMEKQAAERIAQINYDRQHPLGSDVSAMPGRGGKLLHILGNIGQAAFGGLTTNIPGSRAFQNREEAQALGEIREAGQEKEAAQRLAEGEQKMADTKQKMEREASAQNLLTDTNGNVVGWKGADNVVHSLDEPGTPQGIKDVADATTAKLNKPTIEKMDNGDVVAVKTDPQTGKSTSEVVYHGDPKVETEVIQRTVGGQEHKILIDKKKGTDIKDLGAFKTELSPAGQLAKEKADEKLIWAHDANGNSFLMSRAEAKERGMRHDQEAGPGDRKDAENNTSALNEIGVKTRGLDDNLKALDQGLAQRAIISYAMSHDTGGALDSFRKFIGTLGATDQTMKFLIAAHNLRESVLALPKVMTGTSRMTEVQADALWKTIADGASRNSKYGKQQLQAFDQMIGRQWRKVPLVEGNDREFAYPELHAKTEATKFNESTAAPPATTGGKETKAPPATAGAGGPPGELLKPGFKWQQNSKTKEYRQVPKAPGA
jgi:hypothetical protein